MVIRGLGTADVIAAIALARERDLPLCIRGGGHNISGLAVCDGGVMLDMSLMRGVRVDARARTAWAQAGCLLGDVDRETQLHGLATVLGFVSATGIAGLTLGGGFGYLTRRFGWTCDNVSAMDVVTADGKHSVGPEVVGGLIAWPAVEAPRVLELYRSVIEDAPPEFACALALRRAPPAPWVPADVHGTPIVAMAVCHSGPLAEAEKAVEPIRRFGAPVADVIQRRPYTAQQSVLDATQPSGRRYYWKSEYLSGVDPALLESAALHLQTMPSPHSAILLFPIGGAIDRLPDDHSAVGNRNANAVLGIAGA